MRCGHHPAALARGRCRCRTGCRISSVACGSGPGAGSPAVPVRRAGRRSARPARVGPRGQRQLQALVQLVRGQPPVAGGDPELLDDASRSVCEARSSPRPTGWPPGPPGTLHAGRPATLQARRGPAYRGPGGPRPRLRPVRAEIGRSSRSAGSPRSAGSARSPRGWRPADWPGSSSWPSTCGRRSPACRRSSPSCTARCTCPRPARPCWPPSRCCASACSPGSPPR